MTAGHAAGARGLTPAKASIGCVPQDPLALAALRFRRSLAA